jgi:hypothetical protein
MSRRNYCEDGKDETLIKKAPAVGNPLYLAYDVSVVLKHGCKNVAVIVFDKGIINPKGAVIRVKSPQCVYDNRVVIYDKLERPPYDLTVLQGGFSDNMIMPVLHSIYCKTFQIPLSLVPFTVSETENHNLLVQTCPLNNLVLNILCGGGG